MAPQAARRLPPATAQARRRLLWLAAAVCWASAGACNKVPGVQPVFAVSHVDLQLPQLEGWSQDPSVELSDPAKGGIAMRLLRDGAIPGAPRIDVVLEPLRARPTVVEEFLTENLREMGRLEANKQIRIMDVQQSPTRVGALHAYRVRHEYVIGQGAAQVAISQVSTFVVINGRGVAVTAAGRTELFHPLAASVTAVLDGITSRAKPAKGAPAAKGVPGTGLPAQLVEPIDLGKIGGDKP